MFGWRRHIGNYRLLGKVGEGPVGVVFDAVHKKSGYRAAVKVVHRHLSRDPVLIARLLEEAQAVSRVQHTGIVPLLEGCRLADGSTYLARNFVTGGTLTGLLASWGGKLLVTEALQFAWQLAEALAATHGKEVFHRGLTPNNIMFVSDYSYSGGQALKILDFGHAAVVGSASPERGASPYLGPEQRQGQSELPDRADVYALGVILYQMLAGRLPYPSSSADTALHSEAMPYLIRTANGNPPDEVAGLLPRLLAKSPHDRPAMSEVAQALRRLTPGKINKPAPPFMACLRIEQLGPPQQSSLPLPSPSVAVNYPPPQLDPDEALARLDQGCFGLDAPRRMTVEIPVKITAAAARDRLLRKLLVAGAEHGAPAVTDTPLGRLVRVELIPDSPAEFTVTPLSDAEQPVLRTELTHWEWLVTPRQAGPRKRLRLRATNIVDTGGKQLTKSHPVRTIEVEVTIDAAPVSVNSEVNAATVRKLLDQVLPTDATLEAFCLDYFPQILLRFGGGMERLQKVTLLLSAISPRQVLDRLRDAEPEQLEPLLARRDSAPASPLMTAVTAASERPLVQSTFPAAARPTPDAELVTSVIEPTPHRAEALSPPLHGMPLPTPSAAEPNVTPGVLPLAVRPRWNQRLLGTLLGLVTLLIVYRFVYRFIRHAAP